MRKVDKQRKAKAKKARAPRARAKARKAEEVSKTGDSQDDQGFLFEDPYWDDAFCSYYDPTLRTCCPR
jgi:hypothetical protein